MRIKKKVTTLVIIVERLRACVQKFTALHFIERTKRQRLLSQSCTGCICIFECLSVRISFVKIKFLFFHYGFQNSFRGQFIALFRLCSINRIRFYSTSIKCTTSENIKMFLHYRYMRACEWKTELFLPSEIAECTKYAYIVSMISLRGTTGRLYCILYRCRR